MTSNDFVESAFLALKDASKAAIDEGDFGKSREIMNTLVVISDWRFFKSNAQKLANAMGGDNVGPDMLNNGEKAFVAAGKVIDAIKAVRERTGKGLKEAKDLVISYRDSPV